ncbi:MAG: peptidylprolyl isomerase [Spirochaetes bacterium]|nr:peptidylprolyl isomerase [Spirochaetota bacterium]
MKRFMSVIALSIFIITPNISCTSDDDILATYKTGQITRGEFTKWLTAGNYPRKLILEKKDRQKNKLQQMILEILIISKAKEEGFEKSPDFKIYIDRTRQSILRKWYFNDIWDTLKYNEPVIKAKYILLNVNRFKEFPGKLEKIKLNNSEIENQYNEKISLAKKIIKILDDGGSFDDLIDKYSSDSKKESDTKFITYDIMPEAFSDAAFKLKEDEYTREPVKDRKGVYIIKLVERAELTEKNIDDIFNEEQRAAGIKSRLIRKYTKKYLDSLLTSKGNQFLFKGELGRDDDIIFKANNKNYTVSDFKKLLSEKLTENEKVKFKNNMPVKERNRILKDYFEYEVWSKDAFKRGIDKKTEYLNDLEAKINFLLMNAYLKKLSTRYFYISEQELKEEYDNSKDKLYSTANIDTEGKPIKKEMSFEDAKDQIKGKLTEKLRIERSNKWKKQTLEEYNFKINEALLEGE